MGDIYWLYVVWGCKEEEAQLLTIQNPARVLAGEVQEIKQVTRYLIDSSALEKHLSPSENLLKLASPCHERGRLAL